VSGDGPFLSRWSRRKLQARRGDAPAEPPARIPQEPAAPAAAAPLAPPPAESQPEELPPVDSLTPASDFAPFMKPEVDRGLRNQALKALFKDPQFNVMDGLDVYIDDYSKPDPLPEGWLEKMTQMSRLGAYEPPPEPAEAAADAQAEAADAQPAPPVPDEPANADAAAAGPATPPEEASKM
jgi:hypothetical protein